MMNSQEKKKQIALEHFESLDVETACINCGSFDWFVSEEPGLTTQVRDGQSVRPVRIVCNTCGRIAMYDGYILGIF